MRLGDRAIGHLDPAPSLACCCCAPWAAVDAPVTDREALLARVDALERERRRSFDEAQREADALFAQYQLSQLIASGGSLADLAAAVLSELVRLAEAAAGALWLGAPDGDRLGLRGRRSGSATHEVETARLGRGLRMSRRLRRAAARRLAGRGPGPRRGWPPGRAARPPRARGRLRRARACARRSSRSATSWSAIVDGATDLILQVDAERPGRPAEPGRRATARDLSDGRRRPDVCRCARLRGRWGARATCLPAGGGAPSGVPIAYREASVGGADGQPLRVAGSYAAPPPGGVTARATAILRDIARSERSRSSAKGSSRPSATSCGRRWP